MARARLMFGRIAGALFAMTAALGAAPPPPPAAGAIIAGRYAVAVRGGDLVVRRGDATVFSARAFAAAQQAALSRQLGSDGDTLALRHRFSFVSLAGSLLAIRDEVEVNGAGPLPGGGTRFWTVDLAQPATYRFADEEPLRPRPDDPTLLDLRHLVTAPALAAAVGRTALGARWPDSPARRDLHAVLADLSRRGMAADHCYEAEDAVTSSFAVTARTGSRLAVRLGLPGRPACRDALTPLDILLPATAAGALAVGPVVASGALPAVEVRTGAGGRR